MAGPWYVSNTGDNTTGLSWAHAWTSTKTLSAAVAAMSAGDVMYIDAAYTESQASAQTLTFPGTAASPNRVFSCTGITNNPPVSADLGTMASSTGGFTTTGANALTINGYHYMYGVTFNVGTGTTAANCNLVNANSYWEEYDSCLFNLKVTTGNSVLNINSNAAGGVIFKNTQSVFSGGTGSGISHQGGIFIMKNIAGPAISNPNNSLSTGITVGSGRQGLIFCDSVDFSGTNGIALGKNIINAIPAASIALIARFDNCKYTAGALFPTPLAPGSWLDIVNTDSGATNYKQSRVNYSGSFSASTTVYNNATDGGTPISWDIVTTANCKPQLPLELPTIVQWVPAGTYANSYIQTTSSLTLTAADIWVEVQYLGASSSPLGSPATTFGSAASGYGSGNATLPLLPGGTTASTITTTGNWAVGGLGTNYKLAIPSFTTNQAGFVRFVVKIGKASITTGQLSVDEKAVISA